MNIGEKLNKDIITAFERIFESEKLLRMVAYAKKDYMEGMSPSTQELYNIQIAPYRFIPEAVEESKTYLNFIIRGFESYEGQYHRTGMMEFHIFVHRDNVITQYGLRPLLMFGEIDTLFNREKLNGLGVAHFIGFDELPSSLRSHYTHHVIRYGVTYEQ